MSARAAILVAAILASPLPAFAGSSVPAAESSAAPLQAIPVDLRVPFAPVPVAAEGRRHLVYELHLTNMAAAPLELERLEVLDPSGAVVAAYEGEALKGVLARPGTPGLPDVRAIGGGLSAVAFIDVIAPATGAPPAALTHRLMFRPVTPANAPSAQSRVDGGRVVVSRERPPLLGPPLRGGGWVASHALSNDSVHRRSLITVEGAARISQRFAIDWTRIGPDGQVFRGDPADNAHWTPWNAQVLAVAGGVVVERADGVPENDPTADAKAVPITVDNATGDHLVIDIGGGLYVTYAHLRPGSLRVALGQKVRRGQVIAALGNSGKSDAPHLHLQLTDGPAPLASEGLPLVFERFGLQGHLPSLKVLADGTGWRASEPVQERRGETPVLNAVAAFPER
ncbi:MAG: M23 family metallopeptidase [Caulobacter sp.]|nr:M23 family metallopeptidase [Caulobacter sp.]